MLVFYYIVEKQSKAKNRRRRIIDQSTLNATSVNSIRLEQRPGTNTAANHLSPQATDDIISARTSTTSVSIMPANRPPTAYQKPRTPTTHLLLNDNTRWSKGDNLETAKTLF